MEYFCYYLLGHEFTIITDHALLKWLKSVKTDNALITRWALALKPFQFIIEYKPGKNNVVDNFLSHCHSKDSLES